MAFAGKSYLAGLIAEGLLAMDYALCVLDFEGDHLPLGERRGVITVGGIEGMVPVEHVVRLIERRLGSVVVDLSLEEPAARLDYSHRLLELLLELRQRTGLPHWIIVDEAHLPAGPDARDAALLAMRPKGLCLVSYVPEQISPPVADGHDIEFDVLSPDEVVLLHAHKPLGRRFRPMARQQAHVRHWHKYVGASVDDRLRFRFWGRDGATGRTAGNLSELHHKLEAAADGLITFHARRHDFSRWIADVFRDPILSARMARVEQTLAGGRPAAHIRADLLRALEQRYLAGHGRRSTSPEPGHPST